MANLGQIVFTSMIILIIVASFLLILILALTFSSSSSVVLSLNTFPIANLSREALLSCFLSRKSDSAALASVSVTWEKRGAGLVYQYKDGAPALGGQSPQFQGRAQLSMEGLVAGNASLQLKGIKQIDSGVYTCSISSSDGGGEVNVHLRTAAFSAPTFTLSDGALAAVANRWFPKPNVTWLGPADQVLQAITNFTESDQGIYSVVSRLQPVNTSDTYTCSIENQLVVALSRATLAGSEVTADTDFVFSAAWPLLSSILLVLMTSVPCIHHLT